MPGFLELYPGTSLSKTETRARSIFFISATAVEITVKLETAGLLLYVSINQLYSTHMYVPRLLLLAKNSISKLFPLFLYRFVMRKALKYQSVL